MLRPLIEKEVKDLIRDPRIWVPVIVGFLMFPLLGYVESAFLFSQIASGITKHLAVEVRYTDDSLVPAAFPSILDRIFTANGISITPRGSFPERADALLIINSTSVRSLAGGERISAYVVYKLSLGSFTMGSEIPQRILNALINASRIYIASANNVTNIADLIINPSTASFIPYAVERNAIIAGIGASSAGSLMLTSIFIPFIMAFIVLTILQYSATSMAIENEEKTLEILFSMPIPRWNIIIAKLSASAIIGGFSLLGFLVGFAIYESILIAGLSRSLSAINTTVETQISGSSIYIPPQIHEILRGYLGSYRSLGITDLTVPSPTSIAILAIYIVGAAILVGVLGVIIGGLSSDVRMAQTISGQVAIIIMIPAFAMMFINPIDIPRWPLLTNPLTGVALYSKIAFSGLNYGPDIYLYVAISILVVVALIYIAGKMLSLETLERAKRGAQRIFRVRR